MTMWTIKATHGDAFGAVELRSQAPVLVPQAGDKGVRCLWYPMGLHGLGIHEWLHEDGHREVLLSNGAWLPGLTAEHARVLEVRSAGRTLFRSERSDGDFMPMRSWAQLDDHTVSCLFPYEPWTPWDPGTQGGTGIRLHFVPNGFLTDDLEARSVAQRNFVAAFNHATGMPLTRRELGMYDVYELLRGPLGSIDQAQQLRPFFDHVHSEPVAAHSAIDGPHLVRAFAADAIAARNTNSPQAMIARWRIRTLAQDVMNAMPVQPYNDLTQGSAFSLVTNVRRQPGLANVGIIRQWAWCLRCVLEALEFFPSWREAIVWVQFVAEALASAQHETGVYSLHRYSDLLDQSEPYLFGFAELEELESPFWQGNLLARSLTMARKHCKPRVQLVIMAAIKKHYSLLLQEHLLVPDESAGDGRVGVARYAILDTRSASVPLRLRAGWDTSRSEAEPDVVACAFELGVIDKIPRRFVRPGYNGFTHALQSLVDNGAPVEG